MARVGGRPSGAERGDSRLVDLALDQHKMVHLDLSISLWNRRVVVIRYCICTSKRGTYIFRSTFGILGLIFFLFFWFGLGRFGTF